MECSKDNRTENRNSALADYLAQAIFDCPMLAKKGDVFRIAFKGREGQDYGGLIKSALSDVIRKALEKRHE